MQSNKIAVYEGYNFGGFGRRRGRHCRFGVVKRGRRKGQCLKHRRSRR